jgi:hypothetical protein
MHLEKLASNAATIGAIIVPLNTAARSHHHIRALFRKSH